MSKQRRNLFYNADGSLVRVDIEVPDVPLVPERPNVPPIPEQPPEPQPEPPLIPKRHRKGNRYFLVAES